MENMPWRYQPVVVLILAAFSAAGYAALGPVGAVVWGVLGIWVSAKLWNAGFLGGPPAGG